MSSPAPSVVMEPTKVPTPSESFGSFVIAAVGAPLPLSSLPLRSIEYSEVGNSLIGR